MYCLVPSTLHPTTMDYYFISQKIPSVEVRIQWLHLTRFLSVANSPYGLLADSPYGLLAVVKALVSNALKLAIWSIMSKMRGESTTMLCFPLTISTLKPTLHLTRLVSTHSSNEQVLTQNYGGGCSFTNVHLLSYMVCTICLHTIRYSILAKLFNPSGLGVWSVDSTTGGSL